MRSTSRAVVLVALLAGATACTRSAGAAPRLDEPGAARAAEVAAARDAGRKEHPARSAAYGARPDGGVSELSVVEAGDCPAICKKLIGCKAGPFDSAEDCGSACEASIDDRTSAKTYRCVARAKSCVAIAKCTK